MPSLKQIQEENSRRAAEFFEKNPELKLDSAKLFEPSHLRQELQSFGRTKRFKDVEIIENDNVSVGVMAVACFNSTLQIASEHSDYCLQPINERSVGGNDLPTGYFKVFLPINVIDHSKFEKPKEDFYLNKFPLEKGKNE